MATTFANPTPDLEAAKISERIQSLGLSVNTFIGVTGTSKAGISRYFNGLGALSRQEITKIHEALNIIETLYQQFHPFKPDLSQGNGDSIGLLLRDYSKGLIRVKVEDDCSSLRRPKRFKELVVAGGIAALGEGIENE